MSDDFSLDSKFCKCGSKRPKCPYMETNRDPDDWTKPRSTREPKYLNNCLNKIQEKSKIFNNALDVACTLVKLMIICAIPECKAKKAVDSIIYALLHYKCQSSTCSSKVRRIINKEQLYCDLRKIAEMTKCEARLACTIVSNSFKAFYYKQSVDCFNEDYVSQKKWRFAACETIKAYSKYRISSKYNIRCVAWKINNTIQWYVDNKKNKCFPSDFITTCLAPCELPIQPETAPLPFGDICPRGPPIIPEEYINLQIQEQKPGNQSDSCDEEDEEDKDKDADGKNGRNGSKNGSKTFGRDSGELKNCADNLDDCLEKLRELELLNQQLNEELINKEAELEATKKEAENLKSDLDKITNELESNPFRKKNDFLLTIGTKNDGSEFEINFTHIYPAQDLDHIKSIFIKDNEKGHEYDCKKK